MNFFNLRKYFYQLLYSIWKKKIIVFSIILLSTILLVASQFNSIINKNHNDVTEKKYFQHLTLKSKQDNSEFKVGKDKFINYYKDGSLVQNNNNLFNDKAKNLNKNFKKKIFVPNFRLVHIDLKGAPPRISYLESFFKLIKKAGANGILLEYEDMFPYSEPISEIAAKNHYSKEDLVKVINLCKEHEFELIPLIQTFGHLEFALKLKKYRYLREIDRFPTSVCPSKEESFTKLIKPIIDQVISFHKENGHELKYIHIGCDEVFHLGNCDKCRFQDRENLFLKHVQKIASYVKNYHQVIPIIWDDMLRNIYIDKIKEYKLGELVEPMVWTYIKDIYRFIPFSMFQQFSEVFPSIWGASAYKGAFGETLIIPDVGMHLENNIAWLQALSEQTKNFKNVRGIVLTGWQRYDHLAVLCELIPAALPSLITSLIVLFDGGFNYKKTFMKFDKIMNCPSNFQYQNLEIDFEQKKTNYENEREFTNILGKDKYLYNRASFCNFPGISIFRLTENLNDLIKKTNNYIYDVNVHKAWLTDYNIRRNYTNPYRVDENLNEYFNLYHQIQNIIKIASKNLYEVYDKYTVAEWIEQNIYPYIYKLEKLHNDSIRISEVRELENRPLKPLKVLKEYGVNFD